VRGSQGCNWASLTGKVRGDSTINPASTKTEGRKGHRSGTIGDEPAVLMTVRLHVLPVRKPCHFM
jgi:hypothetical protein